MVSFIKVLGLKKLDGELRLTSATLLVISMLNCGEFLQHTLSNFYGRLW